MASTNAKQHEAQHLVQVYSQLELEPDSAEGMYLHCNGRRYIDFYGGHAVTALGYGHPAMLAALENQASTLFFQSNAVAMDVRAHAAEALANFAPAGLDSVFFVNSGAEANENALRIACKLTGRGRIVALEHGFHGRTAAAAAVSWGSADKWYGFPQRPFEVAFMPRDATDSVPDIVTNDTAGVILELIQGLGGAYDLEPAFVSAVAAACAERGALLIIDEVQTGMGRSGRPFATDLYGVRPDMLTTAKSLAGGFPCAALLVTNDIARELKPGDLGSTFGGGPLACALVSAVIDTIHKEHLLNNVRKLSQQLIDAFPLGPVKAVSGKGFLLGLHCERPAGEVRDDLLAKDIIVGTSAVPQVIRLLPPLILEQQHVDELLVALTDC